MYHICKNGEAREPATESEGFKSKSTLSRRSTSVCPLQGHEPCQRIGLHLRAREPGSCEPMPILTSDRFLVVVSFDLIGGGGLARVGRQLLTEFSRFSQLQQLVDVRNDQIAP